MRIRKNTTNWILRLFLVFVLHTSYNASAKDLIAIIGTDTKAMNKAEAVIAEGSGKGLVFVDRDQLYEIL